MASETLEQLQAIDIGTLTEVVRQDQRSPDFEMTEWHWVVCGKRGGAGMPTWCAWGMQFGLPYSLGLRFPPGCRA